MFLIVYNTVGFNYFKILLHLHYFLWAINKSISISDHLSCIMALRKLCNHPRLLTQQSGEKESAFGAGFPAFVASRLMDGDSFSEEDSGKLAVLSCILFQLHDQEPWVSGKLTAMQLRISPSWPWRFFTAYVSKKSKLENYKIWNACFCK